MIIDVHCHLDHHMFKDDLDKVIENAKKAGVVKVVTSGIDFHTNNIALSLSKKYDIVEAALGRYPEDALDREGYYAQNPHVKKTTVDEDIEFMRKHKSSFVAIGECGLDLYNGKDLPKQIIVFKKLVELAIELNKPIVIHSRKAERECLEVLNEYKDKLNPRKVVMHCFSGRKSLINESIARGHNFSIPTNIVRADNFQHPVKVCHLKQILTETDSPYLSPYKNPDGTSTRNEPAFVKETIAVIAKIKNMTEEEIKNQIFMNYQQIFS